MRQNFIQTNVAITIIWQELVRSEKYSWRQGSWNLAKISRTHINVGLQYWQQPYCLQEKYLSPIYFCPGYMVYQAWLWLTSKNHLEPLFYLEGRFIIRGFNFAWVHGLHWLTYITPSFLFVLHHIFQWRSTPCLIVSLLRILCMIKQNCGVSFSLFIYI